MVTRLQEAARELLELKDGPRDAAYEERKEIAWERLREAVDDRLYTSDEMNLALQSLNVSLRIIQGLMDVQVMQEYLPPEEP